MTLKAQAPSQKMPTQEVNDPYKHTFNQSTHTPGSQVSQIDSNSGLKLLYSTADDLIPSQHGKSEGSFDAMANPKVLTLRPDTPSSEYMSRSSSPSTLVGEEDRTSPLGHTNPALNPPDPSQPVSVSVEAPQADTAPTAAPKKKKKNSKKNQKTAATATNPAQPSTGEDYHTYDPFTSQLSHIDAIRRAVKYDTTSYFARTNARIEKEAEEWKEAGQLPKAGKSCSTYKGDVANMYLQVEMGKCAAQIQDY
jgi:hypothetical protein